MGDRLRSGENLPLCNDYMSVKKQPVLVSDEPQLTLLIVPPLVIPEWLSGLAIETGARYFRKIIGNSGSAAPNA